MSPAYFAAIVLIAVQLVGLLSVILARASEGRLAQRFGHYAFWLCLVVVGLATVAGAMQGVWHWPICGFTLGLMVVGATFEPREHAPSHF